MAVDPARLNDIVNSAATVSDRIRALNAEGVPRAEIARLLGKRYQHVRNVLEGDAQTGAEPRSGYTLGHADLSGVRETPAPFEREADDDSKYIQGRGNGAYRLVVRPDGSLLLPKEIAKALDAGPGGVVMAKLKDDEFTLISADTAMNRIREIVRRHIPDNVSLVDTFLESRRAEAEREAADD
jgi:hypothetical protein